jgi:addiction module HigA family antidote
MSAKLPPIHPGEVLNEEFLGPLGVTQYRLAKAISVPARRINEIVLGKRGITTDTAMRLARFFGTSVEFWANLQTFYEREQLERERGAVFKRIRPVAQVKKPKRRTKRSA